mmetsp:Transcript_72451/g.212309  ORF Transcript_72451/g.212309 Transcript_72451/m.212309 type:complete len:498 (+) Transcript_72451:90-1583(+)
MMAFLLGFCLLAFLAAGLDFADPFLGQGTVIQREATNVLWGTSSEKAVTVKLDGKVVANAPVVKGAWTASLPAEHASFNRTLTITDASGSRSQVVSFGDVIMCAGQSNMDMTVNYPIFHADNGTAECKAASRYTGGISLKCVQGRGNLGVDRSLHWFAVTPESLPYYSALCWYVGKHLYEHHQGQVPIGLIEGENGGTPIEKFITSQSIAKCGASHSADVCGGEPDQFFYDKIVGALTPYRVGAILWDQAEADVTPKCSHVRFYPCLEKELVTTWRAALSARHTAGSTPAFVAVQLPGYTGGVAASSSVFAMRLAQAQGLEGVDRAALVPSYDLSCPHCPKGSVHNTDKQDVGFRAGRMLRRLLYGEALPEPPRALAATAKATGSGGYEVEVQFAAGASAPLAFRPTRNCTECCTRVGADFDASVNGHMWANGTAAKIVNGSTIRFTVHLPAVPSLLRYTASATFPQCAIYNQEGFPAYPFQLKVTSMGGAGVPIVV